MITGGKGAGWRLGAPPAQPLNERRLCAGPKTKGLARSCGYVYSECRMDCKENLT